MTYLSGPMTGLPDLNRPAFDAAARLLRGKGLTVYNPAALRLSERARKAVAHLGKAIHDGYAPEEETSLALAYCEAVLLGYPTTGLTPQGMEASA